MQKSSLSFGSGLILNILFFVAVLLYVLSAVRLLHTLVRIFLLERRTGAEEERVRAVWHRRADRAGFWILVFFTVLFMCLVGKVVVPAYSTL